MTIKNKLQQLSTEFSTLKTKVIKFKETNHQTLTQVNTEKNELTQKLNEVNRKLELSAKENSENEKVLEQLVKEMRELSNEL